MKTKIKKDLDRGEGTRLAPGAKLFSADDDSHVERATPLETKMKQHRAAQDLGIDPKREGSTSRKRADKEVKPL